MNHLLHSQRSPGAVVPIPAGLSELMLEISREVLRAQPADATAFVADYLEEKLASRENRRLAEKVVDNVLDLSLDIVAMLEAVGIDRERAEAAMVRIRDEFHRHFETKTDDERLREVFRERDVLDRLVKECHFSEQEARQASATIEQAYRTYYFRNAYRSPQPPAKDKDWRQAVKHSLSIYAQSGPTKEEMAMAAGRIKAAYRGYFTRKREVLDGHAATIQRAVRSHQKRKESHRDADGDESTVVTHEVLQHGEPITDRPPSDVSYSPSEDVLRIVEGILRDDGEPRKDVKQDEPPPSKMDADEAATLIQSIYRGHRMRAQDWLVPKAIVTDLSDAVEEAATLVQSTFRGHMARKQMQEAKTHHQMATLLQSHARGYLARKRHSRNRPEHGDDVDVDDDDNTTPSPPNS